MIVADTILIACLAMPSPYTEAAERVMVRESEWVAPILWRSEFRNVLARYTSRT